MLNKRTYSLTLSDKDISTVRRLVEDVTYRDDAYSLKGPRELRCDKIRIAAALRYCYVHLFHIHQAISEEDISALYSVALSFSVHIITFYVDLPDAQNNMAVKRLLSCFDDVSIVQFQCRVRQDLVNDYFLEMLVAKGVVALRSSWGTFAATTSALSVDAVFTFVTGAKGRHLYLSHEIDVTRVFVDMIIECRKHALVKKHFLLHLRYSNDPNLDEDSFRDATSVEVSQAGTVTFSFDTINMTLVHAPRRRRLAIRGRS
ncbi:hypothetical protein AAVH_12074 [Aphelenchoides avenae]|nr:hypothetical protein AAVH_12074 [Aphelenchus avenae]